MKNTFTKEEIEELLLAESNYWRGAFADAENQRKELVTDATTGLANVLAALNGSPAPWHPDWLKQS